ncbi:MAG: MBL fold metallo-hydrolase [Rhodocyclaceae bacterium]|nr:MBL fold metallo-hydrolase [Rhodocyclaceae bacterium]
MVNIRIHRGANQIGGTCIELACNDSRLLLDIGLPLDGDSADPTLMPDIGDPIPLGVVVSHSHLDHYGLLHRMPDSVPVLMGEASRRIVSTAAPFTGQPLPHLSGPSLRDRETIELGPFRITPYLVDHSAFDAYSLLIEAGGKRIFYSGDIRSHGRKSALVKRLVADPPTDIDLLFLEGSSLTRLEDANRFPSESELEDTLVTKLKDTTGLALLHTSAQNIDRLVTCYRAALKTDRVMVIDLYAAAILEAAGSRHIPQSEWGNVRLYVPEAQRRQIKRLGCFELLARHSRNRIHRSGLKALAPRAIMLFRPLMMNDLDQSVCLKGARYFYSQWAGYLENGSYDSTITWLRQNDIPLDHLHTSGHATPHDLKALATALAPKTLVPIHSFAPEKFPTLFDNVVRHSDGEWWQA